LVRNVVITVNHICTPGVSPANTGRVRRTSGQDQGHKRKKVKKSLQILVFILLRLFVSFSQHIPQQSLYWEVLGFWRGTVMKDIQGWGLTWEVADAATDESELSVFICRN